MDESLTRYIWNHTRRQQIWVLAIVLLSMIPYYMAFDLPKQIVNGPIQGDGFAMAGATQPFLDLTVNLPWFGTVELFGGIPLDRIGMLVALCLAFLALVVVNGVFKLYINTYKGRLGERLLRRIRYELIDRLLRFPPSQFRKLKAAEAASMIKDEVEPLGGFTGDAFVQPVLLGGQALAALFFIFMQNLWLGAIAGLIAGFQVAIIPRMRRRLIELGRQRQLTARQLSGRVNEIIDGITSVHALDTSNYERADVSARLGTIFRIRYDLYQWKFMVKFLNNFLAQVTPFIFYLLGGWLTIRGTLDVGQLVAVINAYKELPGPLKELIDWDQARQDVEVKYEQVVEQFRVTEDIPSGVQQMSRTSAPLPGPITAIALSVDDDGGNRVLDQVSLTFPKGETVAMMDNLGQGAETLAAAIGRVTWPTGGRLCAGEVALKDLPESVTGRKISYAGSEGYFFHGTLLDNLLYGLRHAPGADPVRTGRAAQQRQWAIAEAEAAGNPTFDAEADWIDRDSIPTDDRGMHESGLVVMAVLRATGLEDDVLELGLLSRIDPETTPDLAARIVEIRHAIRNEIDTGAIRAHVVPFEPDRYNDEATISENLLFGTLEHPAEQARQIIQSDQVVRLLRDAGLADGLFDLGHDFAREIGEIIGDRTEEEVLLNGLPFLTPEYLATLRQVLERTRPGGFARSSSQDRVALIRLALFYVEPVHRLGLLTPGLMGRIVGVRGKIHASLPPDLRAMIEPYDPMRYMRFARVLDNILFGKMRDRNPNARALIQRAIVNALDRDGLTPAIIKLGLGYNIGVGGRRLSFAQRQKLNLARTLIRASDYYVFNKSLSSVDRRGQDKIVADVLALLRNRQNDPTVIWTLTNTELAGLFERNIVFDRGRVLSDDSTAAAPDGRVASGNGG